MKRFLKKCIAAALSAVLSVSVLPDMPRAEAAEADSCEKGYIRVLFESGGADITRVSALCDDQTRTVWIDGSEFVGELDNYAYSYDPAEGTAEITVRNRKIGLQVGSSSIACKLGDSELFYRAERAVIKYDGRLWIPADTFFYLLCADVHPQKISDGEEGVYDPYTDWLVVENPRYTAADVLYDIFAAGNGTSWMFSYERDFGMTSEQTSTLLAAGKLATSLYDGVTLNIETIAGWAADPFIDLINGLGSLSNSLFGTDYGELATVYDSVFVKKFLTEMLNTTEDILGGLDDVEEDQANALTFFAEQLLKVTPALEETSASELWEKYMQTYAEAVVKDSSLASVFAADYQALAADTDRFVSQAGSVTGAVLSVLKVAVTEADILQNMACHDDLMAEAVQRYLDASRPDSTLPSAIRDSLDAQFPELKTKLSYLAGESVLKNLENIASDVLLELVGAGSVGLVTGAVSAIWTGIEAVFDAADVEQAEAVQLAVYAMMYQQDAFRELAFSYQDIALANGMQRYADLEDAACLAANYLKACYVAADAGLKSMEGADFAGSDAYAAARTKRRKLSLMLLALSEDIALAKDGRTALGYGLFSDMEYAPDNELTYEQFVHPSTMEQGKNYGYHAETLAVPDMTIYPLAAVPRYYPFIHDELLPQLGMASTDTSEKTVTSDSVRNEDRDWTGKSGLLGADIADMNGDGIDDLLVYSLEKGAGEDSSTLKVTLYTVDESQKGKIVYADELALCRGMEYGYTRIRIGLMEREGQTYLYTETDSCAYFANGGTARYEWYFLDEQGSLRHRWLVGHTDGGSSGLASSVLDYRAEDVYEKYVLCADGEFRYFNPDVEVLTDESFAYGTNVPLRAGLAMLGLTEAAEYTDSENGYFTSSGVLPTLWGTALVKESFSYDCRGVRTSENNWSERHMTVTLADYTGLREKMAALDAAG